MKSAEAMDAHLALRRREAWKRVLQLAVAGCCTLVGLWLVARASPDDPLLAELLVAGREWYLAAAAALCVLLAAVAAVLGLRTRAGVVQAQDGLQARLLALPGKPQPPRQGQERRTRPRQAVPATPETSKPTRFAYSSPREASHYSGDRSGTARRRAGRRYLSGSPSPGPFSPGMMGAASPATGSLGGVGSPVGQSPLGYRSSLNRQTPIGAFATPPRYASPGYGAPASSPAPMQTVYRNCASPMVSTPTTQGETTSSPDDAAFALLRSLPVDSGAGTSLRRPRSVADFVDEWAENLTKSLCKYVRGQVLSALEKNTEMLCALPGNFFTPQTIELSLKEEAGQQPATLEAARQQAEQAYNAEVQKAEAPQQGAFGSFGSFGSGQQQQQQQQQQRAADARQAISTLNRLLDERLRIDKSFSLANAPPRTSRRDVLERLESLFGSPDKAGKHRLNNYRWDSPAPHDQDVLVHIACDWLDSQLRVDHRQQSFAQYHIRNAPAPARMGRSASGPGADKPWWGLERNMVVGPDGRTLLPHYDLHVQGQTWNVRSGRHNALQALVLLLYSMKRNRVVGSESLEAVLRV